MIECIKFNLDQPEATKLFKSRRRQFKRGRFRFDTGFFIPYYLFRVEVMNGNKLSTQLLAIDATRGELDLYSFEQVPTEFAEVETTQMSATVLNEKQALALLQEKVRRTAYLQGFFKISDFRISGTLIQLFYLPYWIAFYTRNNRAEIEVIDAVRGCFEGGKVRDLVLDWFTQEAERRRGTVAA